MGAGLLQCERGEVVTSQFFVYALVDPRNGGRFYIGQSAMGMERPQQHMRPSVGLKEMTPKAKHVRKLLALGVAPTIEVLQYVADPDEAVPPLLKYYDAARDWGALDDAEIRWIAYGREVGWPLKNVLDGGDGLRGLIRTPEHCARISAAKMGKSVNKGVPKSAEHRAKLRVPKSPRTPEHAAKIGAANRGRKASPETIAKMKASAGSGPSHHSFGKKASPETIEKLRASHIGLHAGESNPNYGKTMSDEQKAKISASKQANPWVPSAETRLKLSESHRGEKHPMFGKSHSEEAKKRISETKRKRLELGTWLAYKLAGIE